MAIILLQQTDTPSVDPIGAFGTGATAPSTTLSGAYTPKGFTATNGGAAGSANGAGGVAGVNPDAAIWGVAFETAAGECDAYQCPAGSWVVPLDCNAGTGSVASITWTDCYVIRVNSSGAPQQTIGHTSGMTTHPPTGGGIISATVAGAAATFSAGDRVVILCTFAFAGTTAGVGFISDQIITTPMTGLSITRAVNRFLASLMGLDSGSRPVFSIAGCARAASAAVKYVASFLGLTSGSQQAFSIASCLGAIRRAAFVGLDSGSRQVYAIADCCPPVTSGSGFSGSGSGGSGGGTTGGGCYPPNSCGPPIPPGDLGGGCNLTGYPDILYLNIPHTNCVNFPSSLTIPLWFIASGAGFTNVWIGWYLDPNIYFSATTGQHECFGANLLTGQIVHPGPVLCVLFPCQPPPGNGGGTWVLSILYSTGGGQDIAGGFCTASESVQTYPGLDLVFDNPNFTGVVSSCCQLMGRPVTVTP